MKKGNMTNWLEDIADMLTCFVLYPKFRNLRTGTTVYIGSTEFTFRGLNFWGTSDEMLPQYSIVLEGDGAFGDFSPRAVSLKKK